MLSALKASIFFNREIPVLLKINLSFYLDFRLSSSWRVAPWFSKKYKAPLDSISYFSHVLNNILKETLKIWIKNFIDWIKLKLKDIFDAI